MFYSLLHQSFCFNNFRNVKYKLITRILHSMRKAKCYVRAEKYSLVTISLSHTHFKNNYSDSQRGTCDVIAMGPPFKATLP
jgi:hypothetical protein